jgi:hypothetical protein
MSNEESAAIYRKEPKLKRDRTEFQFVRGQVIKRIRITERARRNAISQATKAAAALLIKSAAKPPRSLIARTIPMAFITELPIWIAWTQSMRCKPLSSAVFTLAKSEIQITAAIPTNRIRASGTNWASMRSHRII